VGGGLAHLARHAQPRLPELFHHGAPAGGLHGELPAPARRAGQHIAYIVRQALDRGLRTVEVSQAAEAEWVDTIVRLAGFGREFLEACTPGYYNNEGKLSERAAQNGFFGGGSSHHQMMKDWREGSLDGLRSRALNARRAR
jgi:cyclohexanone monooxygenase